MACGVCNEISLTLVTVQRRSRTDVVAKHIRTCMLEEQLFQDSGPIYVCQKCVHLFERCAISFYFMLLSKSLWQAESPSLKRCHICSRKTYLSKLVVPENDTKNIIIGRITGTFLPRAKDSDCFVCRSCNYLLNEVNILYQMIIDRDLNSNQIDSFVSNNISRPIDVPAKTRRTYDEDSDESVSCSKLGSILNSLAISGDTGFPSTSSSMEALPSDDEPPQLFYPNDSDDGDNEESSEEDKERNFIGRVVHYRRLKGMHSMSENGGNIFLGGLGEDWHDETIFSIDDLN